MASESAKQTVNDIQNTIKQDGVHFEYLNDLLNVAINVFDKDNDEEYGRKITKYIKEWCLYGIRHKIEILQMDTLYWKTMKVEARHLFESFMFYMERNRPADERFYEPRQNPLKQVVDAIQDLADDKLDELFINMPSRVGKLLSDDTPILTSEGWKNHGDLKVGDRVIGSNGKFTSVIYVHDKFNTTHTVTISDGTKLECHFRHEWTVFDRRCGKQRTLETQEMIGHLKNGSRNNFMLLDKPIIEGRHMILPVDPYVFGVWLGDGSNQKARISGAKDDYPIIREIINRGYRESRRYVHKDTEVVSTEFDKLKDELRDIGMCQRSKRVEKHIPQEFLIADVQQRLDLLAGLLDTDGCLRKKEHRYDYVTCEEALKNDVISLISTFGWRCSVKEVAPKISSSGIIGRHKCWVISFNPTIYIPCKLERKQLFEFSKKKRLAIDKIEESEHKSGNCITVANWDGIYLAGKRLTPTHNTQIVKFAFLWWGSRNSELSNLYTAYSDRITTAFYTGLIELIEDQTYTYAEIFPENVIKKKSGEDLTIDLVRKKTYPTYTCRSIYGTLNGSCDCNGLAVADDLFSGIDEAISVDRQQTVWQKFDNNFMKRLKRKAKLINMGTRWALGDVQGRRRDLLENDPNFANRRWRLISIPALDENDESNFDYPYDVGYSTEDYKMIRASFEKNDDMASWYAQDQQEPIERMGALFTTGDMKFFNPETDLPDRFPDRIFMAIDEAFGGGDFVAAPVCYQWEDDYYIMDAVFNSGDKKITQPLVRDMILKHKVQAARFEETKTTAAYREDIEKDLKDVGYRLNSYGQPAPGNTGKRNRILDRAPEVREMYFLEPKYRSNEYERFLQNMYQFKKEGKVKHDDAPDAMGQLCEMKNGSTSNKVEATWNPFRRH